MSENGEIYTAGKNFTLLPGLTGWTNFTSAEVVTFLGLLVTTFTGVVALSGAETF